MRQRTKLRDSGHLWTPGAALGDTAIWARRLREARLGVGLSQKQLGVDAGLDAFVASTRINRYEVGVHQPDFLTLSRLAAVLQVPTAYFYAQSDALAEAIKLLGTLDDSQIRDAIAHVVAGK